MYVCIYISQSKFSGSRVYIYIYIYIYLLYGFEESCILIGRRAVCKNPYSDRGP